MATYVNDLRLKEITTGDESGTWGTSTNTNLELIAEAFSYGTEVITTNADTHTTTIDDGASDPGRSLYLKYTGTLDSACTITIGPDTVSKVWIIENGTSGSQDIIISQGSGADITIPAGDTKVVYSDGAGAGAAFFDAFASLSVVDLKVQDDLTVTGDIDVDGTTNLDVVDIDGAVDMASTALVTGVLTTTAATVFNGGFASNAASTISTADNLDTLSLISTDADANSGPNLRLYRNSGSPADNDLVGAIDFEGRNDNSQDVVYSQIFTQILDASDGTEDGYLSFKVMNAGTSRQRLLFDAGETVFNDESEDVDFRVESDNNANALFVQGSDGYVGIGVIPTHNFNLQSAGAVEARFRSTDGDCSLQISSDTDEGQDSELVFMSGTSGRGSIVYDHNTTAASQKMLFKTGDNAVSAMTIDGSGNVGIGTSSPRVRFQVTPASNDGLPSLGTAGAGSVFTSSNGLYGLNIGVDPSGLTWMQAMRFDGVAEAYDIVLQASGGNVGIGTSSFSSNYRMSVLCATGTGGIIIKNASTTGVPLLCVNTAGSEIGSISTTNTATAYNTSSDYRLKEDDVLMTGATERVKALRPINFAWKVDGSRVDGFLAHEVQEIVPEAITKTKDAMRDEEYEVTPAVKEVRDEDGNVTTEAVAAVMGTRSVPDYQGIDQSKLVPLLTAALQEAITKIEDLTTRLETLENA
jgi:hypothetical protein